MSSKVSERTRLLQDQSGDSEDEFVIPKTKFISPDMNKNEHSIPAVSFNQFVPLQWHKLIRF